MTAFGQTLITEHIQPYSPMLQWVPFPGSLRFTTSPTPTPIAAPRRQADTKLEPIGKPRSPMIDITGMPVTVPQAPNFQAKLCNRMPVITLRFAFLASSLHLILSLLPVLRISSPSLNDSLFFSILLLISAHLAPLNLRSDGNRGASHNGCG